MLYNEYKSIVIDKSKAIRKWLPVLDSVANNTHEINERLAIFSEKYQMLSVKYSYHKLIELPTALNMVLSDIEKYIAEDDTIKLKMVGEYYNVITKKTGILLENNERIEDGKFLNPEYQNKLNENIDNIIENRIEKILSQRKEKLKRILNV